VPLNVCWADPPLTGRAGNQHAGEGAVAVILEGEPLDRDLCALLDGGAVPIAANRAGHRAYAAFMVETAIDQICGGILGHVGPFVEVHGYIFPPFAPLVNPKPQSLGNL
jgi:hypothetical protein